MALSKRTPDTSGKSKKSTKLNLFSFIFQQKWLLIIILVLILLSPLLTSWMNFYLQDIFNAANASVQIITLLKMLTVGFSVWMMKRIIEYTSGVLKAKFLCNIKQDVKHAIFRSIFKNDTMNILNNAETGEYISVFTNDINILEQRFFGNIIGLISNAISLLILGTSFFTLNHTIAVFIFIFAILTVFIPVLFSNSLSKINFIYSNKLSFFTQKLKEFFTSYPMIKNYSIENKIISKFDEVNKETEDSKFEFEHTLTLANNISSLLSWFLQFIAIGIGLVLLVKGNILIGTVISSQAFASDVSMPLQEILFNANSIRSIKKIVNKISSYDCAKTEDTSTPDNDNATENQLNHALLTFDNISLTLGKSNIINNFSFSFESGKKYLIIGKNGSGKSSIFKILKKYIGNAEGDIKLNGKSIKDIDNASLSKYVSYINEKVSILTASVKDNISLYQNFSDDNITKALKIAKVNVEPDRIIRDEAINLSSGEQRKIELARSILRTTPIIIFDEVVSTLDIETAYEIEKMLLSYRNTIIFISHNFSGKLIKSYDEILVMDDGCLIAHGKYDDLIRTCDYFKKICEIKFGDQLATTN